MYIILNKFNINDISFYHLFFNYSTYCYFTYFFNFLIEFFLFIYIVYHFLFCNETRTFFKGFFIEYIGFLFFLICTLYFILIKNSIITCFHLISTSYVIFCKLIIISILILILLISQNKFMINPQKIGLNELPAMFNFLLLFICILLSSSDFFVMYLIVEGISLIIYSLGSIINQSLINIEAILKYFLVNNLASSFLLWSISYLYILTGTTDSFEIQYILISSLETIILEHLYYICFFFILSLLFKLAIFPFHWWIADIYEGLWTPITLCYAVLIKMTFFLFLFKILLSPFYSLLFIFQPFLLISALGSVVVGSLGALVQVKIKRFLAYTSIAQSGYIIIGLAANSLNGFLSSFLYLFMYIILSLSFFCILLNLEQINKGHNITYLNQLYSVILYNKEITCHMIIILLVMAAIPPFSSFFAKFLVFVISMEAKFEIMTLFFLSLSLISTFYYLIFIQQLIFFKFNNNKIIIFKETFFNLPFLRICSFFFSFSFFFLSSISDWTLYLLLSCLWSFTN